MSTPDQAFQAGLKAYRAQDYAAAEAAFLDVLRQHPTALEALINLGNVYFQQAAYDKAQAKWKQAIAINPLEENAYYNLGNAYFCQGMYSKALYYWEIFKAMNPDRPTLFMNMGLAYEAQRNMPQAFQCYNLYFLAKRGLESESFRLKAKMEQADEVARHNLAIAEKLMRNGFLEKARRIYADNIALIPLPPKIYKHYAAVLFRLQAYEESVFWYERAYQPSKPETPILVNMAVLYEKLAQPWKALWAYSLILKFSGGRSPQKLIRRYETLWAEQGEALVNSALKRLDSLIQSEDFDQAEPLSQEIFEVLFLAEPNRLGEVNSSITLLAERRNPKRKVAQDAYHQAIEAHTAGNHDLAMQWYDEVLRLEPNGEMVQDVKQRRQQIKDLRPKRMPEEKKKHKLPI